MLSISSVCYYFRFRLSPCHSILHIHVSTSHQTLIPYLLKSPLPILKMWYISQHQLICQLFVSADTRTEMETLSLIIGMFVIKYIVEEVDIK